MIKIFPLHDAAVVMDEKYKDWLSLGQPALHHRLVYLEDTNEYVTDPADPTPRDWAEIIVAYIKDYINECQHWSTNTSLFEKALERVLPQYIFDTDSIMEMMGRPVETLKNITAAQLEGSLSFSRILIGYLDEIIDGWLEENILIDEEDRWVMWVVETLGEDALIRRGQDFRIADWERRMASGEWKVL